jgi:26S proteasome regulatory subunit T2
MEEEFIRNQEVFKPREEQNESERAKVDDLRGTPLSVGTLEEIIDDNHAIVASSMGPEYYVTIMSFVNKDNLEPGSSVLLHNKVIFFINEIFNIPHILIVYLSVYICVDVTGYVDSGYSGR